MALTNVALDLIGQARFWLSYAGEVEGAGPDEDQLAYLRDAHDFHNLLLIEQPNDSYADTLVWQFFFDSWHYLMLEGLVYSADRRIAAIAEKSLKEVRYHVRRSGDLIGRLGDGTDLSHSMMHLERRAEVQLVTVFFRRNRDAAWPARSPSATAATRAATAPSHTHPARHSLAGLAAVPAPARRWRPVQRGWY